MSEITKDIRKTDALTAATVALARSNIPVDVLELLVQGNPMRNIRPGALSAALDSALQAERNAATERERARAAAGLEQKAAKMRGSPTGDMMARIFEAEAAAIRTPDQTQPANPEDKT